jgi:hypothetical protein
MDGSKRKWTGNEVRGHGWEMEAIGHGMKWMEIRGNGWKWMNKYI